MVAGSHWLRTKMLVGVLAVVLARVHRLARDHAPGLAVVPARVLVQGLEARVAAAPGPVIVPSRRASHVPARLGSRVPSQGQVLRVIVIDPSRVESPRIGTVPNPVTNLLIVRRVGAEIARCRNRNPALVPSRLLSRSHDPGRVQSPAHAPSLGTSLVRGHHHALVPDRTVAVVAVVRVVMIGMWIWRTEIAAAQNMMAETTRGRLERNVFYVTQVLGNGEEEKDNLVETFLESFPFIPSYCSLDVIYTSPPSFISLHETNHCFSLFS